MPDQFRRGVVIEGRGSQVRVQFADDDLLSPWLEVTQAATRGARLYARPKVGTMVAVTMDRHAESGVVIGAVYSDEDPPPADSDEITHVEFGDGTTAVYDEGAGALTLTFGGGLQLRLSGDTLAITGNVTVSGDVSIDGDLTVSGKTDLQATKINGVTQEGS